MQVLADKFKGLTLVSHSIPGKSVFHDRRHHELVLQNFGILEFSNKIALAGYLPKRDSNGRCPDSLLNILLEIQV